MVDFVQMIVLIIILIKTNGICDIDEVTELLVVK